MNTKETKPKRYTIADIKHANQSAGLHFFDRDTMRFFGDTMRSFGVRHIDGRVFVTRKRAMKCGGGVGKVYEFTPDTGEVETCRDEDVPAELS